MALVLIISLYTTRVVLNVLGVEDYGIYNVVAGFVTMFAFLKNAMTIGIQRFFNYENGKKNGRDINLVYNTALQIQLLVALLLFILLETVGVWYINNVMVIPDNRLFASNVVFQMSSISLLFLVMQAPYMAAVMAYERMKFYAYISIVEILFRLLIVFVLPYISYDKLAFYGLLSLGVSIIDFLLYYIYCKRHFKKLKVKLIYDKSLFYSMVSFSGYNTLDMFAYTAKSQGVNVLMNYYFGPIINAARGISAQVMGAVQGFCVNIVTAYRPQIVESYAREEYDRTQNLMFSLSKVSYILLYFLCVPVVINIDIILNLWLGDDIPQYTSIFVILSLVDMVISSLNSPFSIVVQATGHIKRYQIIRSMIVTSILLFSYIAFELGMSADITYWISIIVVIINQFVSGYLLKKEFPFNSKEYFKEVIYPCLIFSLTAPIVPLSFKNLFPNNIVGLIYSIIISVIASLPIAYWGCLNIQEKYLIKQLIKSKIKK